MARRNTVPYSTRALEADAYDKRTGLVHDAEGTVAIEDAMETSRSADSEAFLFPTSFAQQRLWFFEQLYPGSAVYHLSTVLPFDGPLDRKALEDSLGDLLDRHEALRTTFTAANSFSNSNEPSVDPLSTRITSWFSNVIEESDWRHPRRKPAPL